MTVEAAILDLVRAALPWTDVRAFGAIGDGATDDSAAVRAALDAMPTGGVLCFPPTPVNRYRLANVQIDRSDIVIRAAGTTLVKAADGPVFTVQNGPKSAAERITFEGVTIDGDGGNHAGVGIAWVHGGRSKLIGCTIRDTASYCLDFAVDAGARLLCSATHFAVYQSWEGQANENVCAIRLPADTDSTGREFTGCSVDGKMLEDGGSENTHLIGGFHRGFTFTGMAKKLIVTGQRITGLPKYGTQLVMHSGVVTGNAIARDVLIDGQSCLSTFEGNTVWGNVTLGDKTAFGDPAQANVIGPGNRIDGTVRDLAGVNRVFRCPLGL